MNRYFVTGGAGFIGSNLVRYLVSLGCSVLVFDKFSYAGNRASLSDLEGELCRLVVGDICDTDAVLRALDEFRPDGIFHLAAESHVDRSIDAPSDFINTNILGTYSMLQAARKFEISCFVHVSTDEVYGSLSENEHPFTEETKYASNSPYSASKAASDHLARAIGCSWMTIAEPLLRLCGADVSARSITSAEIARWRTLTLSARSAEFSTKNLRAATAFHIPRK